MEKGTRDVLRRMVEAQQQAIESGDNSHLEATMDAMLGTLGSPPRDNATRNYDDDDFMSDDAGVEELQERLREAHYDHGDDDNDKKEPYKLNDEPSLVEEDGNAYNHEDDNKDETYNEESKLREEHLMLMQESMKVHTDRDVHMDQDADDDQQGGGVGDGGFDDDFDDNFDSRNNNDYDYDDNDRIAHRSGNGAGVSLEDWLEQDEDNSGRYEERYRGQAVGNDNDFFPEESMRVHANQSVELADEDLFQRWKDDQEQNTMEQSTSDNNGWDNSGGLHATADAMDGDKNEKMSAVRDAMAFLEGQDRAEQEEQDQQKQQYHEDYEQRSEEASTEPENLVVTTMTEPDAAVAKESNRMNSAAGNSGMEGDDAFETPMAKRVLMLGDLERTPAPNTDMDDSIGLLSPFSPILKHRQQDGLSSYLSFVPCRKVSAMVRVLPTIDKDICVFPLLMHLNREVFESVTSPPASNHPNTGEGKDKSEKVMAATMRQACQEQTRSLVVVNPSAMGLHIPTELTMETARLVAHVAKMESEDWLRKYSFDHVEWPLEGDLQGFTMDQVAQSIGNDVGTRGNHRVCLGMGFTNSDQTKTLLGTLLEKTYAALAQAVVTLSVVEIVDEHTLEDWLDPNVSSTLKIRHPDNRGAIVQNLTNAPIDGIEALADWLDIVAETAQTKRQSHGHIVATLRIYKNSVDQKHDKRGTWVQFVDLASGETPRSKEHPSTKQVGSIRKSLSALRGILRNILQQEAQNDYSLISYRECALTKLLQRSLEPTQSRVILLGTVSQQREAYDRTLHTLNFIHRLFQGIGTTAHSPFDKQLHSKIKESDDSIREERQLLQALAKDPAFLDTVVSDPRQRLARLFPKTAPRTKPVVSASSREPRRSNRTPGSVKKKSTGPGNSGNRSLAPAALSSEGFPEAKDRDQPRGGTPANKSMELPMARSSESIDTAGSMNRPQPSNTTRFPNRPHRRRSEQPVDGVIDLDTSLHREALTPDRNPSRDTDPSRPPLGMNKEDDENSNDNDGKASSETPIANQDDDNVDNQNDYDLPVGPSGDEEKIDGHSENEDDYLVPGYGEEALADAEKWIDNEGRRPENDEDAVNEDKPARETPDWTDEIPGVVEFNDIAPLDKNGYLSGTAPNVYPQPIEDRSPLGNGDDDNHNRYRPRGTVPATGAGGHEDITSNGTGPKGVDADDDEALLQKWSADAPVLSETPLSDHHYRDTQTSSFDRSRYDMPSSPYTFPDTPSSKDLRNALNRAKSGQGDIPADSSDPTEGTYGQPVPEYEFPAQGHRREVDDIPIGNMDDFLGDIHDLQAAVEGIKTIELGLWQSSATALDRIQHFIHTQQSLLRKTAAERKEFAAARNANEHRVVELENAMVKTKRQLLGMERQLRKNDFNHTNLESVAEEAISANETLEREIRSLQMQLSVTERTSAGDYARSNASKDKLYMKLKTLMDKNAKLSVEHSRKDVAIADLHAQLIQLREERDASRRDNRYRTGDDHSTKELRNTVIEANKQIARLQQENASLKKRLTAMRSEQNADESVQAGERDSMRIEIQRLQSEILSYQRRLQDAESSGEARIGVLESELAAAGARTNRIIHERDQLQVQRNHDTAELDALRVDAAAKEDTTHKLESAKAELNRSQRLVQDLMAQVEDLRAERAVAAEERASWEKTKLERHSFERKWKEAEAESERRKTNSSEEKAQISTRLSNATKEIAKLKTDLSEANGSVQTMTSQLESIKEEHETQMKHLQEQLMMEQEEKTRQTADINNMKASVSKFRLEAKQQFTRVAADKKAHDDILQRTTARAKQLAEESTQQKRTIADLESACIGKDNELRSLRDRLSVVDTDKTDLHEDVQRLRSQMQRKDILIEKLRTDLEASEHRSSLEANEMHHTLRQQLQQSETKIDELQDDLAASHRKITTMERTNEHYHSRITDLEIQLQSEQRRIGKLQNDADEANRRLERTRADQLQNDQTRDGLAIELQQIIDSLKSDVESLTIELKNVRTEKSRAEIRVTDLEKKYTESIHRRLRTTSVKGLGESELQLVRDIEREITKREHLRNKSLTEDSSVVARLSEENQNLREKIRIVSKVPSDDQGSISTLNEERSKRKDAEELVAALASRSKTKIEERNILIRKLQAKLAYVSEQKEAEIRTLRARLREWELGTVVEWERISHIGEITDVDI